MTKSLAAMAAGERGILVEVRGGGGLRAKLANLGIRPGMTVIKVSAQLLRGPVTVRAGRTEAGIGYGMACRLLVDVTD